jgi:hypothetical protein
MMEAPLRGGNLKDYARLSSAAKRLTKRSFEGAHSSINFLVVNRQDSAEWIVRRVPKMRAAEPLGGVMEVVHKLVAGVFELFFEFGDRALGDPSGRSAPVVNGFRVAPDGAAQVLYVGINHGFARLEKRHSPAHRYNPNFVRDRRRSAILRTTR